jgi:hypothetical protein
MTRLEVTHYGSETYEIRANGEIVGIVEKRELVEFVNECVKLLPVDSGLDDLGLLARDWSEEDV